MNLSQTQLSYFVTVAEAGQIAAAATILDVAEPAVSQAVAQLESQLGVRLLERHSHGVRVTAAGRILLEKACRALDAQADAAATAASLARQERGAIQIGFLSAPPFLIAPRLMEAFSAAHPQIAISARELRFPTSSSASWLADVDVALCHSPVPDADVETLILHRDARAVVMRENHPLAGRTELRVADVLGETFYGLHPAIEPDWSGFWSLDDHRGGPPASLTGDRAGNTLELVAAMTSGSAITTVPAPVAAVMVQLAPHLVARELTDAAPAAYALVWHSSRRSSVVADFVEVARALAGPRAGPPAGPGRRRPVARAAGPARITPPALSS